MTLQISINDEVKARAAHVRKEFLATDDAIALVLKQVFPGIHIYGSYAGFCNHNGQEVEMELPPIAQDWKGLFDQYTPEQRKNLPNIRFQLEVPDLAVNSMGGDWSFNRVLSSIPNIRKV